MRIVNTAFFRVAVLAVAVFSVSATQQSRGLRRLPIGKPQETTGRRLFLAIGIDRYDRFGAATDVRDRWPQLSNAVSDAVAVASTLTAAGFKPIRDALLEGKATRDAINGVVEDELPRLLKDDDDLVVFFAGHGFSQERGDAEKRVRWGYLIPADAAGPNEGKWHTYIHIPHLLEQLGTLPARHILVILDSCRSGMALGAAVGSAQAFSTADAASRRSRIVISSADFQQNASDVGPILGHSLFTGFLLKGLQTREADLDKDGEVTDAELGLYLQAQVKKASEQKQLPMWGGFLAHEFGSMTIPAPDPDLLSSLLTSTPPPSEIAAQSSRGAAAPSSSRRARFAIVIGNDNYADLPPLRYAVTDAKAVADALVTLGYDVQLELNKSRNAVLSDVRNAVDRTPALGSLVLFFAGHTFSEGGSVYLALSDSTSKEPRTSAIRFDDLKGTLSLARAQQRSYLIDACAYATGAPAELTVKTPPPGFFRDLPRDSSVLAAADQSTVAFESDALGHGIFSYYVVRGLRGEAAGADGIITFSSLSSYVTENVLRASVGRQRPFTVAAGDFPLGVVEPRDR